MSCKSLLCALIGCITLTSVSAAAEGEFNSKGVKIRYVTEGEGEAVVLIHGWLSDSTMWGPKLKPLEGFKLIALDCRGHGKSDKPHDPKQYGAEMAFDVVRLLDHLKIKKAHLVGYSMGAFIAAKVAATQPKRVQSIIFGGQAPLLPGEAGSKEIDVFAEAVEAGKGLGPYLKFVRPELSDKNADALAKFAYEGKDTKAWALAGKSFSGLEVKLKDLQRANVPMLFIHGSKEAESTKLRAAALHAVLSKSTLKVVEGGDHGSTLAKPEFGIALVDFLRANRAGQ